MKIPLIIVLFMLFSFGKPSDLLDSNGVWNKMDEFINDGTMDFNQNYFIFDLKNYSTIHTDNTKRYTFTQKQKHLYDTYKIKNYLFIVNDIDSRETIITLAKNLQTLISKNYGSVSKSIIICMAIDIRKTRIEIGSTLNNYIYDEDALLIIDSIGDYMRSADYFNAFCKVLEKVEYYYNLGKSGGGSSRGSSSSSSSSSSEKSMPVWVVIIIVLIIVAAIGITCFRCISRGCDIDLSSSGSYTTYSTYSEPRHHHHHGFGGFHSHGGGYHKSGGFSSGGHSSGGHRSGGHSSGGHSSGGGGGRSGGGGGRSGGRTGGATGGW